MAKKETKSSIDAEVKAINARLKKAREASKPKKKAQFESWSFTRYNDYRTCPLKAKLKHLDKIEEPPNQAMARGADIGRLCELYIKGKLKKLPEELLQFGKTFNLLRDQYKKRPQSMVVEDSWTLTKAWEKTEWNDWKNAWVRVKIDAGHLTDPTTMRIIDFKTGKFRDEKRQEYIEQLELYCLSALMLNPQLKQVSSFLAYLDVGVMFPEPGSDDEEVMTFTRADIPKLKATWDKRTRAMLLDKSFAARPNATCRYCHYRKENTSQLPWRKQLCKF